jgi:hypothetical protein
MSSDKTIVSLKSQTKRENLDNLGWKSDREKVLMQMSDDNLNVITEKDMNLEKSSGD